MGSGLSRVTMAVPRIGANVGFPSTVETVHTKGAADQLVDGGRCVRAVEVAPEVFVVPVLAVAVQHHGHGPSQSLRQSPDLPLLDSLACAVPHPRAAIRETRVIAARVADAGAERGSGAIVSA